MAKRVLATCAFLRAHFAPCAGDAARFSTSVQAMPDIAERDIKRKVGAEEWNSSRFDSRAQMTDRH